MQSKHKYSPNLSPAPPSLRPPLFLWPEREKGRKKALSSARPWSGLGRKGYTATASAAAAICDASNETELFMSANRVSSSKVPPSPFRMGGREKDLKNRKRGRSVYEAESGKKRSLLKSGNCGKTSTSISLLLDSPRPISERATFRGLDKVMEGSVNLRKIGRS